MSSGPRSPSEVREAVISRDRMCIATIFPDAGPCFDRWGDLISDAPRSDQLEMDYVRLGARGRHHELECDHVALCAGHHRGEGPQAGYIWATAHRGELRGLLDRMYPREEE